jgi:hypothetical protein
MAYDLGLHPLTHDLTGNLVTGRDEILQRLRVRLWRLLGEWFLAREAGLPWYDAGRPGTRGILGGKNYTEAELRLRSEVLKTKGVLRILNLTAHFKDRQYALNLEVLLDDESVETLNLEM